MGRQTQQINSIGLHIHRDFSHRLGGIGKKENTFFFRNVSDLLNRHDHACLVIGIHHSDQYRIRPDGFTNGQRIHTPALVYRQYGHLCSDGLQVLTGIQHGLMLHRRSDNVLPFRGI